MADRDRERLAMAYNSAAEAVSLPSMGLGMWAGRGDYASLPQATRDKAGVKALADIDTAIAALVETRNRVAAAVRGEQEFKPGMAWVKVGDHEPVLVETREAPDGDVRIAYGHARLAALATLDAGSASVIRDRRIGDHENAPDHDQK